MHRDDRERHSRSCPLPPQRAPFDRDKLLRSIMIATRKRPISEERVERVVSSITRRLESSGETEIPSSQIGQLVMEALASLDMVAYVRFASVYKNFRETRDFEQFLETLSPQEREEREK